MATLRAQVNISLTMEEYHALDKAAGEAGCRVGQWCKEAILEKLAIPEGTACPNCRQEYDVSGTGYRYCACPGRRTPAKDWVPPTQGTPA